MTALDPYAAFCTALFATAATVSLYAIVGSLVVGRVRINQSFMEADHGNRSR